MNKKQKRFSCLVIIFLTFNITGIAQKVKYHPQPEIGESMPNFTLKHVTNFKKKTATLDDFKGKWLFLDFWSTGCKACILSFPKVSGFQEKFKNQIEWVMVGLNDKAFNDGFNNRGIEGLYERLKKKQNLKMVSAYDSVLMPKWGISMVPHIKIIDPNGILYAETNGVDITEKKIQQLLDNEKPYFGRPPMVEWDPTIYTKDVHSKGLLYSKNSVLVYGKNNELPRRRPIDYQITEAKKDPGGFVFEGYQASSLTLSQLYLIAYLGTAYFRPNAPDLLYEKAYPQIVFETKDTALFKSYNQALDDARVENREGGVYEVPGLYNYAFSIFKKDVTKEYLMQIMQQDLKNYFGYEVSVEKRKMPVWNMIALPGTLKKLKSKGGEKSFGESSGMSGSPAGFTWTNIPGDILFLYMTRYIQTEEPIFDKTGFTADIPIDIIIDGDLTHLEGVKKALQKVGMDLVKGEKEFEKVIVVRDPEQREGILTKKDSIRVNEFINTYVPSESSKKIEWNTLDSVLQKEYPILADEILSKVKVEYYIFKEDWTNFESSVKYYMENYKNKVSPFLFNKYAWLIFKYGTSKESLKQAYHWTRIALRADRQKVDYWYTYANIRYKQGRGGINYMENFVLKGDPDNKEYKEALRKMKQGAKTWVNPNDTNQSKRIKKNNYEY